MKKIAFIITGFVLITMFQNCSPVSYKALEGDLTSKVAGDDGRMPGSDPSVSEPSDDTSSETPRDPADDGSTKENPRDPRTPGNDSTSSETPRDPSSDVVTDGNEAADCDYCKLLDEDRSISPGAQDFTSLNQKGAIKLDAVRDVRIEGNNGSVRVADAANFLSIGGRGAVQAKSRMISEVSTNNGMVCLVAEDIGKIDGIHGTVKVAAKRVESISSVTGMVKIYGATVQSVTQVKNVCLYEGAQIINVGAGVKVQVCDKK